MALGADGHEKMIGMWRLRRPGVTLLIALSTLGFAGGVSAQSDMAQTSDVAMVTSPDGLVTAYVPDGALPQGISLEILQLSPQDGPRELRGVQTRTPFYRLTPRSAAVNLPITIVRRYRTAELGFEDGGAPIISQAMKGPGGWRWLDEQHVFIIPAVSEGTSSADDATRAGMADSLRRSLGLAPEAFMDPFEDPTIDLVVAGTTDRLGVLTGFGGGAFLVHGPAAALAMPVGERRAFRGQADVDRSYGGRTTDIAISAEPPEVVAVRTQALHTDRTYAAVLTCEAEGEALALTEVTFDRLGRRVSLFDGGPLAALGDGAGARVTVARPVACLP